MLGESQGIEPSAILVKKENFLYKIEVAAFQTTLFVSDVVELKLLGVFNPVNMMEIVPPRLEILLGENLLFEQKNEFFPYKLEKGSFETVRAELGLDIGSKMIRPDISFSLNTQPTHDSVLSIKFSEKFIFLFKWKRKMCYPS